MIAVNKYNIYPVKAMIKSNYNPRRPVKGPGIKEIKMTRKQIEASYQTWLQAQKSKKVSKKATETSRLQAQAIKAKALGYERVASVVKSVWDSTYYHIVELDDIINIGKWTPANIVTGTNGWHGRAGVRNPDFEALKMITKMELYRLK